jgi:hypothetical protein
LIVFSHEKSTPQRSAYANNEAIVILPAYQGCAPCRQATPYISAIIIHPKNSSQNTESTKDIIVTTDWLIFLKLKNGSDKSE